MNRNTRSKAQRAQFEALVRAGPKRSAAASQARSLARRATKVTLARVAFDRDRTIEMGRAAG